VVGHEAQSQQRDFRLAEVVAEDAQVGEAVLRAGESFATVDSPLRDVALPLSGLPPDTNHTTAGGTRGNACTASRSGS
jgi:hypothetical protein